MCMGDRPSGSVARSSVVIAGAVGMPTHWATGDKPHVLKFNDSKSFVLYIIFDKFCSVF